MVTIMRATAEDADTLSDIMIRAWQSAFRGILSDAIIEQYTVPGKCSSMFSQILVSGVGTMYLAKSDGVPAGLLYWLPEENSMRIEALLTVPEAWGCGVGAALMEKTVSDAAALEMDIHVWPFAQNARARRFYEKWGFRATGAKRMSDALEMEYIRKKKLEG